jgi:hypothetical protein
MDKLICRSTLAMAALVGFAGTSGAEDLTIVAKVTRNNEAPVTQVTYVSSEKMRAQNEGGEFMVDFASGQITIINTKKKEYSVITPEDVEAMAAQMSAQMKQMEEQMKAMPPALREKMGGMMGGLAASTTVTKGTGGRTVAGYTCENWNVTIGEMMRQEQCVTTQIAWPMPAYDGMARYMKAMSAASPMLKGMDQMVEKFKQMKGISVYHQNSVKMMGRSMTETSEVVEVKKDPIPASTWAVPADFKKTNWKLGK